MIYLERGMMLVNTVWSWMMTYRSLWAVLLMLVFPFESFAMERIQVAIHKGRVVNLSSSVDHIAVGSADVADIQKLDASHLYVIGRRIGTTSLVLCSTRDCFKTIEVEVTHDLEGLRTKLHEVFPNESPSVYSSEGAIVLSGQVSSVEVMNGMMSIAGTFTQPQAIGTSTSASSASGSSSSMGSSGMTAQIPGTPQLQPHIVSNVLNLMQVGGPQQVMLGVTVAEISRRLARSLKVDFTAFGGGGNLQGGAIDTTAAVQGLMQVAKAGNPAMLFLNFIGRDATVQTVINAAKTNGLVKILAEPNLTTISGQDAEFVSGGEFPVPVPQFGAVGGTGGGITVQFKEYGVILKFLPVVLNSGRISLKLNISVSEIDATNAVQIPSESGTFVIPALTKRSAASAMELDDGQTLGIAGLISDRLREQISKFPGLGDLPILGQLFTSQDFQKDATELMIFVTPHLAKPMDPRTLHLPTDTFVEPTDADFYLKGRTEGTRPPVPHNPRDTYRYGGGLRGQFGQQP